MCEKYKKSASVSDTLKYKYRPSCLDLLPTHLQPHRSSPPTTRRSKKHYRRSSSMYPPFDPSKYHYLSHTVSNELNYNYMTNYASTKCVGGGSSSSSSGGSASGTATNSPSYSIANDDLEIFNRLNREDLMIDHFRWLSEKPISVLQLDPADRAVLKIAGEFK